MLQSPWGVASGAIAGHLVATLLAIMGGAFLANYISEKLVLANAYTSPFTEPNRSQTDEKIGGFFLCRWAMLVELSS